MAIEGKIVWFYTRIEESHNGVETYTQSCWSHFYWA